MRAAGPSLAPTKVAWHADAHVRVCACGFLAHSPSRSLSLSLSFSLSLSLSLSLSRSFSRSVSFSLSFSFSFSLSLSLVLSRALSFCLSFSLRVRACVRDACNPAACCLLAQGQPASARRRSPICCLARRCRSQPRAMPAPSPSELLQALGSGDADSQLQAVRTIKNGIIGNKGKKTAFSSAGAVPRLVEIVRNATAQPQENLGSALAGATEQDPATREPAQSEVVVHAVAALGSFAFGSYDGNSAVMAAGAFPLLKRLLYSRHQKVVAAAARTIKIILEVNPPASQHIFQHEGSGNAAGAAAEKAGATAKVPGDKMMAAGQDLSTVERLVQLVAEGQEGTAEVAASLLARACQTREQQRALSAAGAWEITDSLLLSSPKGQEAGLDLAASMVRGNAVQAAFMLRRPSTNIVNLLAFVRHRRPCTRLLACTCIASAAACGAFPVEQHQYEVSVVLHTAIKLLSSEPHKEIKEKAPNVIALLVRHNDALQCAAAETGLIDMLVSQVMLVSMLAMACARTKRGTDVCASCCLVLHRAHVIVHCVCGTPLMPQGEAHGASVRERNAVMGCLECIAASNEDLRSQVGKAVRVS